MVASVAPFSLSFFFLLLLFFLFRGYLIGSLFLLCSRYFVGEDPAETKIRDGTSQPAALRSCTLSIVFYW